MKEPQNILGVAALQPDWLGFIFYEKSPRFAGNTPPEAINSLSRHIKRVGVFVNTPAHVIVQQAKIYDLNILQLHGKESPEFCKEVKETTGCQLIKVFGIGDNFNYETLIPYQDQTDFFLFDTQTPEHGGSGKRFAWDTLHSYAVPKPYLLSGGVGVEHLEEIKILWQSQPYLYGIDVNSRFETQPGIKNVTLLKTFIEQLRNF